MAADVVVEIGVNLDPGLALVMVPLESAETSSAYQLGSRELENGSNSRWQSLQKLLQTRTVELPVRCGQPEHPTRAGSGCRHPTRDATARAWSVRFVSTVAMPPIERKRRAR